MSYDLHLFKPFPGETIEDALKRSFPESEELNPGAPVPEKETLKKRLAAALIKKNPNLEPFKFGFKDVAEMLGTSEEEAELRWRHIELNGPEDGNGIQITLYDDTASITIPYWQEGEKAESTFREVWDYIEVFRSEAGYVAYDPQLERVVSRISDMPDVLRSYGRGRRVVEKLSNELHAKAQKPWWKLW
jgi:hypothetical protein